MPRYEPLCDAVEVVRSVEDLAGFAERLVTDSPRGGARGKAPPRESIVS